MFVVCCCLLFVVCCSRDVRGSLVASCFGIFVVVRWLLLVVGCWCMWFVVAVVVCCSLFVVRCLLCDVLCRFLSVCDLLLYVGRCSVFVVRCVSYVG